jgi:hypothetical protein
VLELADRQTRTVRLDDEGADAAVPGGGVGLGEHGVDAGDAGAGDPGLAPVEDPLVAVTHGARGHGGGVAPGVRLGEAVARLLLPGHDRREHPLLELFAAVGEERGDTGAGDERRQRGGPTRPGQLLDHERGGQEVAGVTAVLGRVESPDEPGVPEGVHARPWVRLVLVGLGRLGGDLLLGEASQPGPELLVLLRDTKVPGAHNLTW